jgi:class 3 adenylate cyclase/predicted ATPase
MDIAGWLRDLGLAQYEAAFREHAVDEAVLPSLTSDDLRDLGVAPVGHRRRLLDAIADLRAASRATEPLASSARMPAGDAERRQLTVMFCDLVGSTELSSRLDPEDLGEVIAAYHGAVASIVEDAGGFISRFLGDGVLVYFGYPQAHENDAERAVRAGLDAIAAIGRLDVKSVKLSTRVGIATGMVVVGDRIGRGSVQVQSVVGETPNLAARLQTMAEPDTVVIAAGTRRLVGDLFEYRELGPVALKGIAAPVPVWQVLRPSVVASRFEALRGGALTRLVDREEEIDALLRRWARAKAGSGQVVLISGEAGIGKSRIAAALGERLAGETAIGLRYFCSPYHQDSALFPFVEHLARAARFMCEDPPERKLEKLAALFASAASAEEDIPFIADLLSLPASPRYPLPPLGPRVKKERTLEALMRHLEGLARHRPLVIVLEDAHWIDPTSRELVDLAVERVRNLPALLIITFRPEFQPPWVGQQGVTLLALNRLDRRDRMMLVEQVAGAKALPEAIVAQIADRTDGVPLFVEELTKSVLESGILRETGGPVGLDRGLPPSLIPTSLHDLLMARLDRLSSVRYLAQIGASIGREFSYALLREVSGFADDELEAALDRLVASELVIQRGAPPDSSYMFKHALMQDAAHGSLLRSTRHQLHARIAEALAAHHPELVDSQPQLFAQHYAEAGLVERSVEYWGKAGRRSAARSAMAEAVAQFQKGLDQLALLPETPERQRQELEFWSALGPALRFAKGQGTPEMGHAFARARALWEKLGSPPEFHHIPYGQSFHHVYRGEFDVAQRLDEDLLRVSHQRNDLPGLVLGHASSGRTLMFAGKFALARSHLEQALALYDPIAHGSLGGQTGSHPGVGARGQLGIALFCLGFPEQAVAQGSAAIAEATALGHAPSLAASLAMDARVLALAGNDAALDQRAGQLIAIAAEQGFPMYRALGTIYRGFARVRSGEQAEGMALLRSGASAYGATGAETRISFHAALLAEGCEIAGQVDEALSLLEDALQVTERIGERWFAAELCRRKGRVMLRRGDPETAAGLFREALAIAREQDAKLWELRAAASLARWFRDRDRRAEAHELLAPVYHWFTEGFDSQDLVATKLLLGELNQGAPG